MNWFNYYGLIFITLIMIPNIVFAIKVKDGFTSLWNNKIIEILEQIGRFGCFAFMIINIPETYFGFFINKGLIFYLVINSILVLLYCLIWVICFKENSLFRAIALSVIPSLIFIFSGIMIRSILLIILSSIFAPCHIMISCENERLKYLESNTNR